MRGILIILGAAFLTAILVAASMVRAPEPPPADTGGRMATAAEAYVGTLGSAERDRGTWSWTPSNASIGISYLASATVSGSRT